jgi:hypothetical protein
MIATSGLFAISRAASRRQSSGTTVSESTSRRSSPMRMERPLAAQGRCEGEEGGGEEEEEEEGEEERKTSSIARLSALSSMSYAGSYSIIGAGVDERVSSFVL